MIIKANSIYMPLADKSVQAIITSPPYWGLRKYDVPDMVWGPGPGCEHDFTAIAHIDKRGTSGNNLNGRNPYTSGETRQSYREGFCSKCGGWRGQLGLEPTSVLYISHLMQVMSECWRVLKNDGVCFVNLGDTYSGSGGAGGDYAPGGWRGQPKDRQGRAVGVKTKSLCFIPERFALACLEAGWIIRNKPIWHKPNGLPSSAQDRFSVKWEQIYMLVKQRKYYFDLEAVRTRVKQSRIDRSNRGSSPANKWAKGPGGNPHKLSQPQTNRKHDQNTDRPSAHRNYTPNSKGCNPGDVWQISTQGYSGAHFATFPPKLVERMLLCSTKPGDIVLDPFGGSGTVGRVAIRYRRRPMLLDLGYQDQQVERMKGVQVNLCL